MKIAAALTSMDAARTYTEVNSFALDLQTQQQAIPLNPDPFNTRFRSLIGKSSPSPRGSAPNLHPDQIIGPGPEERQNTEDCNDLLRTLTGEIVGRPIQLLATDTVENNTQKNNRPLPFQATIISRLLHYEKEEVYFSSNGKVTTEDGREFSFSLDLSMQRTTLETRQFSTTGDRLTRYLLDPLVLSFTGGPPTFANTSFLFDLDCDGKKENIAQLQPGCGFLAFDKNDDGCINNGLELFGPLSGNGFTDLSVFDEDSNLWIDENDPIFDSLSIWRPDGKGTGTLLGLKEAGVGAIALSHASARFTLQGTDNEILAQVAANGIFLTEEGEVRSLQEIDLAIGKADQAAEDRDQVHQTGFFDAMTSLRVIIAMQRMRARLLVARNRMERPDLPWLLGAKPLSRLSPSRKQHSIEQGVKLENQTDTTLKKAMGQVSNSPGAEPTVTTQHNRKVQDHMDNESVIRPMISLDELRGFIWPNKPNRDINLIYRMSSVFYAGQGKAGFIE